MISHLALTALLLSHVLAPIRAPKWLDYELAGYAFANDEKHHPTAIFDPRTHYMLIRVIECDGADMTLLLTKDRYEVDSMGIGVPGFSKDPSQKMMQAVEKPLPSLSTGKGITIDTPVQSVTRKLGKPSKRFETGKRHQFLNLLYHWVGVGPDGEKEYEQTYVFKSGRLIEVLFTWDPFHEEDKAVIRPKAKAAVSQRKSD